MAPPAYTPSSRGGVDAEHPAVPLLRQEGMTKRNVEVELSGADEPRLAVQAGQAPAGRFGMGRVLGGLAILAGLGVAAVVGVRHYGSTSSNNKQNPTTTTTTMAPPENLEEKTPTPTKEETTEKTKEDDKKGDKEETPKVVDKETTTVETTTVEDKKETTAGKTTENAKISEAMLNKGNPACHKDGGEARTSDEAMDYCGRMSFGVYDEMKQPCICWSKSKFWKTEDKKMMTLADGTTSHNLCRNMGGYSLWCAVDPSIVASGYAYCGDPEGITDDHRVVTTCAAGSE